MVILPEEKLIFLANPRTASVSVTKALVDNYPDALYTKRRHHCTVAEYEQMPESMIGCEKIPVTGFKTFTVIRNPWDLVASWFVLSGIRDFDVFLDQYTHTFYNKSRIYWFTVADYILKYEQLETDLIQLLTEFVTLPHENVTKGKKPFLSYYNH